MRGKRKHINKSKKVIGKLLICFMNTKYERPNMMRKNKDIKTRLGHV